MTIEEYLKEYQITVKELEEIVQINRNTIRRHLKKKTQITSESVVKKFKKLGIELPHVKVIRGDRKAPPKKKKEVSPILKLITQIEKEKFGTLIVESKKEVMLVKEFCKKNWYNFEVNKTTEDKYKIKFSDKRLPVAKYRVRSLLR